MDDSDEGEGQRGVAVEPEEAFLAVGAEEREHAQDNG